VLGPVAAWDDHGQPVDLKGPRHRAVLARLIVARGRVVPLGVLILGYFLGHIGNLVPLPGGIGGVETGMVGVFVACGMSLSLAVVGTIAYQLISTWLPVFPGLGAYWSLRRRIARWREEPGPKHALLPGRASGGPTLRRTPAARRCR